MNLKNPEVYVKKNPLLSLTFLIFLSGCSVVPGASLLEDRTPPTELNNACSILYQKPSWVDDLRKAKSKYGIKLSSVLAMMYQESKFIHDARPIKGSGKGLFSTPFASSALGYSQALEMTWAHYKRSAGVSGVSRDDFGDSAMFMGWYVTQSNQQLSIGKNDVYSQYLAYHEGQGGYSKKTYLKKPWLIDVAKKVKQRELMYAAQLNECDLSSAAAPNFFVRYFM